MASDTLDTISHAWYWRLPRSIRAVSLHPKHEWHRGLIQDLRVNETGGPTAEACLEHVLAERKGGVDVEEPAEEELDGDHEGGREGEGVVVRARIVHQQQRAPVVGLMLHPKKCTLYPNSEQTPAQQKRRDGAQHQTHIEATQTQASKAAGRMHPQTFRYPYEVDQAICGRKKELQVWERTRS